MNNLASPALRSYSITITFIVGGTTKRHSVIHMSISPFAYSNNIAQAFFDNNDDKASGVLIAVVAAVLDPLWGGSINKSKSPQELIEPVSKAAGSIYGINYACMHFVEACEMPQCWCPA